jgi:hypothetical protein
MKLIGTILERSETEHTSWNKTENYGFPEQTVLEILLLIYGGLQTYNLLKGGNGNLLGDSSTNVMDKNTNNKETSETPLCASKKFFVFILGQELDKCRQIKLNNVRFSWKKL